MAKVKGFTTIEGLNAALRMLPKEASAKLRDASVDIAADIASEASGRARSQGGAASLVAPSIRATRDRVPVVKMGGSTRLPASGNGWARSRGGARQTIGDVIWGAEFGGGARPTTLQFQPHRGRTGYFLWPTVRDNNRDIHERYSDALLKALEAI